MARPRASSLLTKFRTQPFAQCDKFHFRSDDSFAGIIHLRDGLPRPRKNLSACRKRSAGDQMPRNRAISWAPGYRYSPRSRIQRLRNSGKPAAQINLRLRIRIRPGSVVRLLPLACFQPHDSIPAPGATDFAHGHANPVRSGDVDFLEPGKCAAFFLAPVFSVRCIVDLPKRIRDSRFQIRDFRCPSLLDLCYKISNLECRISNQLRCFHTNHAGLD